MRLPRPDSTTLAIVAVAAFTLIAAGCGDDDAKSTSTKSSSDDTAMVEKDDAMAKDDDAMAKDDDAMSKDDDMSKDDAMEKDDGTMAATGTTIRTGSSDYGKVLFDRSGQAIYAFELDGTGASKCYDDCAEAWPPVLTKGAPAAGAGIDAKLLGTVKRTDGATQVTYAGRPLYFYAHEAKNEVKCHNINVDGGYWWALTATGENAPT